MKLLQIKHHSQAGMTLIEVLIAMLITAIGLLGVVGLQTMTLKSTMDTVQRSVAISMANELVERLKANPYGREQNLYLNAFSENLSCNAQPKSCADHFDYARGAVKLSSPCSPQALVTYDAWDLSCSARDKDHIIRSPADYLLLPKISLSCQDSDSNDELPCSPYSEHQITISWTARSNLISHQTVIVSDQEPTHSVRISSRI